MKINFSPYLLCCLLAGPAWGQSISIENLKKHVTYLSSDALEGRATGTKGAQLAAHYLAGQFRQLKLKPLGSKSSYLQTYTYRLPTNPHDTATTPAAADQTGTNVAGLLDNGADYTVVIGAHYDHLGLGYDGNSLDPNPKGKIHNGADDNASGTAGVIELARYFTKNQVREAYNFLFVGFSGEELGLYGSKKFTEANDLTRVNYMLNMDMIGRLDPTTRRLLVMGVGTAPEWVNLLAGLKTDLQVKTDSAGVGPSDQTSFYLKKVPALMFFTGQHKDYHKPTDDADRINYEGEKQVLTYIAAVIRATEKLPRLTFTPTKNNSQDVPAFKVTLGVMPDYVYDGKGVRLDGVSEGKPAATAGLRAGDVVIRLGDTDVSNIQDYMKALSQFKKGDRTAVKVLRAGTEKTVEVTF